MKLEELVGTVGDFVQLSGLDAGRDSLVDASAMNWSRADIVLTGLSFERVKVKGKEIRPSLVECKFNQCRFEQVKADNAFWGAGDSWSECDFNEVRMLGAISPANRFTTCIFGRTIFEGYHPFDTVYECCEFVDCTFLGLKAPYLTRKAVNPEAELKILSTSVLFKSCKFTRTKFRGCHFANVRFESCTFDEPVIEHSDFSDCIANPKWWRDDQQGAPMAALLEDVVELAAKKLGSQCKTVSVLRQFLLDLELDPAVKNEYVKRTVDDIPDEEQDALEKEFIDMGERYSP